MRILYLCPDLGIPVLGRKGAAVHVRQLVAAFVRSGHSVVVAAAAATKSPWEQPATLAAPLMLVEPRRESVAGVKEFTRSLGASLPLAGELRRILSNHALVAELERRFRGERPDVIYERASLFSTVGICVAATLDVPLFVELNAPVTVEQATYRQSQLVELGRRPARY